MGLTVVSIVVTVISIVCSVISIVNARKAKRYKEDVFDFKNAIEIKGVSETFKEAYLKFVQETRLDDWYRGKDINIVLSPMESTLAKLDAVYPLMADHQKLKERVKIATKNIRQFDRCNKIEKRNTYEALDDIGEILQGLLHKQTAKALK